MLCVQCLKGAKGEMLGAEEGGRRRMWVDQRRRLGCENAETMLCTAEDNRQQRAEHCNTRLYSTEDNGSNRVGRRTRLGKATSLLSTAQHSGVNALFRREAHFV